MMAIPHTVIERESANLLPRMPEIIALANGEKEALGFLSHSAYEDAIKRKRLMAMLVSGDAGQPTVVGFILRSGVYPDACVQQVCVRQDWRRRGVASALVNALVSDLERVGFLTVKAKVASDLPHAQAFYERQGFEAAITKAGGRARGRTIIWRVRNLDTPHLFSDARNTPSFGLPKRFGNEAPFYTFDLNVFFDLVKERGRHEAACALFGAALGHRIRLIIASEFIEELRRTSTGPSNDPILPMALQLPRLPPPVDPQTLDRLAGEIHDLVFVQPNAAGANSPQARSDARHLAHSALSHVSGFITSDGALLAARDSLLEKVGVDVANLDELLALLPGEIVQQSQSVQSGQGFECREPSAAEATAYLQQAEVPASIIQEVSADGVGRPSIWRSAIWEGDGIVALVCLVRPAIVDGENRLLVHVDSGHLNRELYADYLLDTAIRQSINGGPTSIRMLHVPGQPTAIAHAKSHGFMSSGVGQDLTKAVIGQPLTQAKWDTLRHHLRRKMGLTLPAQWPDTQAEPWEITIGGSAEGSFALSPERFEDMFGPTLFLWPSRAGVIVPIRRDYANELLGTNAQARLSFIENRDASFLSQRAYVNTPRARGAMRPGLPILFYESSRDKGRSAIIAVGRIVDSVLATKDSVPEDAARRVVVDDVSDFSASDDILMTTFDNLMIFPNPVPLSTLKSIGAVGPNNLISATPLSHDRLVQIIEAGWRQ